MPASSSDLIDAALFSAFSRREADESDDCPFACVEETQHFPSLKQASLVEFDHDGYHKKKQLNGGNTSFDSIQSKYGLLKPNLDSKISTKPNKILKMAHSRNSNEDKLEEPKTILWSHDKVLLGWRKNFPPGAGMINLGNTCYMNSSLQALFHIPALANWLLDEAGSHISSCEANSHNASFCSICGMMRTLKQALDRGNSHIKPSHIHNKLKCIGKTLIYGRQEDAHEFIKLLLDHMEKSFLTFMKANRLDHRSKETTPLNQIFGGYLRQQVICPLCCYVSTTFSHFQDIVLDIRSVGSVEDALNLYFRKETLDSDNAYKCENCHKKVPATKRHLIEKAPHVLLLQLKRFTMSGGKITRHINIDKTIDLSRYVNGVKSSHGNSAGSYIYKFVSMVIHIGGSQHGGHYTAVAEASNKTMFEFDDSSVRAISMQTALLKNPYILFYEMVQKPKTAPSIKQVMRQSSEKVLLKQNSADQILKPLTTSFSTNCMSKTSDDIGEAIARKNNSQSKNSPLLNMKDRERISFGLKFGNNKGPTDHKYSNNNNSSVYADKSVTTNNSPHSKSNHVSSSLVPYKTDSEDSGDDINDRKLVNGYAVKENGHCKVYEDKKGANLSNGTGIKIQKSFDNVPSQSGNNSKHITTFLPRTLQVYSSNKSSNSSDSKCNGHSTLTNGFSSDSKNLSSHKSKFGNGVDVANSHVKGKLLTNDKSPKLLSQSRDSNFDKFDQSLCRNISPTPKEETQDKISKENLNELRNNCPAVAKQKPELEKSLSQDSVLPFKSNKIADKIDTASLKSKDSLDSNKSSMSMKKSLLSYFGCVGSTHSPELSPEHERPNSSPIKEDLKSVHGSHRDHFVIESCLSKRNRDRDELEPTSPSKKCRPVDRLQSTSNEYIVKLKCFKSKNVKDSKNNGDIPKNSRTPSGSPSPSKFSGDRKIATNASNSSTKDEENFSMEDKKSRHKRKNSKYSCASEDSDASIPCDSEERTILNPNVVQIPWNKNIKDLSNRTSDSKNIEPASKQFAFQISDKPRNSSVVDELKRAGDYSFGIKVDTWDGGQSLLDSETQRERNEARKRTADEIYNEELDAGRVPKKRHKNFEYEEQCQRENPFQSYQNTHFNQLRDDGQSKSWEGSSQYNFKNNHYKNNFKNKKNNNHSRSWNPNFRSFDNQNHFRSNSYGSKSWKQKSRNGYHNKNRDNFWF